MVSAWPTPRPANIFVPGQASPAPELCVRPQPILSQPLMRVSSRLEYCSLMSAATIEKPDSWQKEALAIALDERAREIDLYWKRTAYSWALTAAAFAGYFAIANAKLGEVRYESLGVVACLGMACSAAWYCINRGSKYWQENWEIQVDLLELEISGPLHRVNPEQTSYSFWKLNQAFPFSVSKVNQLLSLFIVGVWIILAIDAATHLSWSLTRGSPVLSLVGLATLLICIAFGTSGRTTPTVNVLGKTIWLKGGAIE